jgi:NADPH:quinone reductase-like Zn-dependent oxidoreductase
VEKCEQENDVMRAIEIREPGGPEVLTLTTRDKPVPGDTELLIKVAAAGVNRPDCLQRQGRIRRRRVLPIFPGSRSRAKLRRSALP